MPEPTQPASDPQKLDTRGMLCPLPMLLTALAVEKLAPGSRVEMVGDDPAIAEDIPTWCQETGHRLVEMKTEGKNIRCLVEKVVDGKPTA